MRIDGAVAARFPDLALAWLRVAHVEVAPSAQAEAIVRQAAERVRATRTVETLKDDALFRCYRDYYWRLGIDPTKTRPAGEALNRRVLNGHALPAINAFVDGYNAASLLLGVPIGAYDAARLHGGLVLREARAGEPFHALTDAAPRALVGGELVLADEATVVNFYPYRDAAATRITDATREAVLVACGAPGVPADALREALDVAAENLRRACGARIVARSG